ncbi:MAG: 3-hydroxyacyl-[acyl-carrier-protein] dehydratase FabZ [Pseudobacteriovorax sp.]|nr:3-hydroxyacyl-[acyl-carrier-protein] dehydratase FabZ [Pseudobacteriovorax sp.]
MLISESNKENFKGTDRLLHRPPFLLVDRILARCKDTIKTRKNISANEPVLIGHFPQNPIFPAAYIIEFMAQSSGLIIDKEGSNNSELGFVVKIDKAIFKKIVVPGDILTCSSKFIQEIARFHRFECSVHDEHTNLVAKAEIYLKLEL